MNTKMHSDILIDTMVPSTHASCNIFNNNTPHSIDIVLLELDGSNFVSNIVYVYRIALDGNNNNSETREDGYGRTIKSTTNER